ncbi:MAG TPA: hypothetical protein VK680_05675 [Solirubrobacteraceae bacterium]|nr:hypothetical protein [Solirubrobacteraceae bacterium]
MKARRIAGVALSVPLAIAGYGYQAVAVFAQPASSVERTPVTSAARPSGQVRAGVQKAPSSAPLTSIDAVTGGEEDIGQTPQGEADPLVSNGLGSPSCKGELVSELSATGRRNCETSGFAAAPAPTGNYGLDVHIDSGLLNTTAWGSTILQDMFVTPLWTGLVWAVHALVVMLEWSFSIDLFDGSVAADMSTHLRQMEGAFTEPWLPIALAIASVLALYHGMIRRRVADTLGEVMVMVAMMVGGIWIIANPAGTVGALGQWADEASLGTLAVAAHGSPSAPGQTLGTSLDTVFAAAIEVPWCYMEFGNVGWCREPARLDPRLRVAGLKIAAQELASRWCEPSGTVLAPCVKATAAQASALEHSAELLRAARSNGAVFLALPANGPARNSINNQGSLLRTLCQSAEATNCHGPNAAQAEFRTAGGTLMRILGVLLISSGLLGLLLLLGFVAVRLLTSAVFSMLYLLVAPVMVLAPAFGDGGRALFRKWIARLLAAVVSELVFSFLLGIALATISVLSDLTALGWWMQWLLMSSFWWGAYAHRHHALGIAEGTLRYQDHGEHTLRRSVLRRARDTIEHNQMITAARWAKGKLAKPAPDVGRRRQQALVGKQRARAGADEQSYRMSRGEHDDARHRVARATAIGRVISAKRAQLERLEHQRAAAVGDGQRRRATSLAWRAQRVSAEIEHEQATLNSAKRTARDAERAKGGRPPREQLERHGRFLDAQVALPNAAHARAGERRDYASLSGLAGYGRVVYERLSPPEQRLARLEIDRELALRKDLRDTAQSFADAAEVPSLDRREGRRAGKKFDGAVQQHMRDAGHRMPTGHGDGAPRDAWLQIGRTPRGGGGGAGRASGADRSSVMRDAREVAARRKRQLGRDRP